MQAGEPLELPQSLASPGNGVGYLNRFLWLDQMYYLPDDILYKSDRMSMAHSLEVRPPFLDHRIVEFAARLPQNLKIRGGQLKFVLRELMKNRLPRGRAAPPQRRLRHSGARLAAHNSASLASRYAQRAQRPAIRRFFPGRPSRPPSAPTWSAVLTSGITYGDFWFCSSG